jgi:signal transduction histidine kinase
MDNFQSLRSEIRKYLIIVIILENILLIGGIWYFVRFLHQSIDYVSIGAYGASIIMTFVIAIAAADYVLIPLKALWQAIIHLSPSEKGVAAPEIDKLTVGRTLVANLTAQIYQIVTVAEHSESLAFKKSSSLKADFIANNLPLPLIVLDGNQTILFVNNLACSYIGRSAEDIINQNVYSILNMSFPSDQTLDSWLKKAKASAVTTSQLWERVRLNITDNQPKRLFDLAAYYNKDNPQHYETLLVLFDHTSQYSQDDQAISFVALSVHELRTPLALLRGYIEAFDEETKGTLNPELDGFMSKMNATAQQLSAFVNNILNVARVDNDQLSLQLHEEVWSEIIQGAVDMMSLRAKVRDIDLTLNVAKDLPTVGVDRVSIQEVIANLIDNAIKYSGSSKQIVISTAINNDGSVETSVQDFGVGVPTSVLPNLFTKFYRDHHNRAQIGGTGLGLYLCKAIVNAHGGNIWVKSKEGKGATFGFTLLPYAKLAEETKNNDNKEIVRSAHGWIKNHSLYRR